jgi:hypothetical protein
VLGTTELDGTDDTCPMFMSFDDENQKKTYEAPPSKEDGRVREAVRPTLKDS